jgi:hypothetical protein
MIRAPFIRLALLALCSLYVLGLVLIAVLVAWWWALAVVVLGVLVAVLLSIEVDAQVTAKRDGDAR